MEEECWDGSHDVAQYQDESPEDRGRGFGRGKPFIDDSDAWGSSNEERESANLTSTSRGYRGSSTSRGFNKSGRSRGSGRTNGDRHRNDGWSNGNRSEEEQNDNGWGSNLADNDNKDKEWGENEYQESARGSRGRGRGRGRGEGRGRGGRGAAQGSVKWGSERTEEKPREQYIPPEPTCDENEIFSMGNSTGINFSKYDNISVNVSGENPVQPIESFESSGLRNFLLVNVKKSGYLKPTPIQKHAVPIIMNGRDVMACAQTGSGKTAAFLLPIINTLLETNAELVVESSHSEPQVVIVSPTRELAIQIHEEARKFAHGSIIRTVVAYGGTVVAYQSENIRKGCHILVATPGRLMDFVRRGRIQFNSVKFVILDEADRMLDMGFMSEMENMMNHDTMPKPGERQTLMFSATFPTEIQVLAGKFLKDYLFITVGIVGGACSDVEQRFFQVDKFEKRIKLLDLLKTDGVNRTLVFVETKRMADFIAVFLCENDIRTTSIHGDRLQREREEALRDFKSGSMDVLVATAVAARGLDIKNVKHVINFDLPKEIDEYVHRIGRTGRVGNRGKATSFYDSKENAQLATDLIKILEQAGQSIPDWMLRDKGASSGFRPRAFGGRDVRGESFGKKIEATENAEEVEEW